MTGKEIGTETERKGFAGKCLVLGVGNGKKGSMNHKRN